LKVQDCRARRAGDLPILDVGGNGARFAGKPDKNMKQSGTRHPQPRLSENFHNFSLPLNSQGTPTYTSTTANLPRTTTSSNGAGDE
jgi:hypothetical protein